MTDAERQQQMLNVAAGDHHLMRSALEDCCVAMEQMRSVDAIQRHHYAYWEAGGLAVNALLNARNVLRRDTAKGPIYPSQFNQKPKEKHEQ